jgi:hypothetical protein
MPIRATSGKRLAKLRDGLLSMALRTAQSREVDVPPASGQTVECGGFVLALPARREATVELLQKRFADAQIRTSMFQQRPDQLLGQIFVVLLVHSRIAADCVRRFSA